MDMSFEIIQALKAIAREKDVDENLIIESLQAALVSAARKKYGALSKIVAEVDENLGRLQVYCIKDIVEKVEDPQLQVSLKEAREVSGDCEVGQEFKIEIPPEHFGRNAIQAAKQVVIQRIREAERDRVYREFEKRIGEVVTGGVQQVDRGSIIVNLGKTEAVVPQREQIPREQFRQGNSIKAYIVEVSRTAKGPQVVLSRSHSDFMRKLFTMEVPEIESGIVEIKNIAREPGSRSKIAVVSNDDRVDAVGACVGMKGSRVQSVVRELGGERIDVVLWSDSPIAFVTRALSPAKVVHAQMDEGDNKATVVVADDQLSLAIGKGGQNARLAAKLTGLKIDLINESQYSERLEFEKMAKVPVADVPGVDEGIGAALAAAGYDTAQHLAKAAVTDLAAIDGLDEGKARAIIDAARQCITEIRDRSKAERPEAAPAEQDAGGGSEAQAEEVEGPDETSADDAGGASVGGPDVPGDEPGASGEIEGDVT